MPDRTYHLRDVGGRYLCVDPSTPTIVEWRETAGPWEAVSVVRNDDGWSVLFTAAQVLLSIGPEGELSTRPQDQRGAWETVQIAEQPPDWQTVLLYRLEAGVLSGALQLVEAA